MNSISGRSFWGRVSPLLLNPLVILLAIVLGGVTGWLDKGNTQAFGYLGDIYVRLLQMCVIPLLLTAVVLSLSKLFSDGASKHYVGQLFLSIGMTLLVAATTGVFLGYVGSPGSGLAQEAREVIGQVIFQAESAITGQSTANSSAKIAETMANIVPENIFLALSSGNKLAILFFSILFGVALGSIGRAKTEHAIAIFESLYDTFIKIISWLMYGLPFALFCLSYNQVSEIGLDVLFAMTKLVVLIYIGALFLIAASSVLIWRYSGKRFVTSIAALRESVFVAFGTANGFAAVPAALRGLKENLQVDKTVVDLVVPLGISLNPPGSVFHFAISAMFMANLYGMNLDFGQILFVLVGSAMAGIAAAGAPGVAALSMISVTLVPLGLPVEVAIILLVAIDPIVDPILTVVNVQANSAMATIMGSKGSATIAPTYVQV